jgi:hypothetical protein
MPSSLRRHRRAAAGRNAANLNTDVAESAAAGALGFSLSSAPAPDSMVRPLHQNALVMRICRIWMTVIGLLIAAGITSPAWSEEVSPLKSKPDGSRPAATPAPQGLKAVVDPATGQFTVPPRPPITGSPEAFAPPTIPSASAAGSSANLATSHDGLVAVRGTTRAGGLQVDLKGRFRSSVIATVGPDGKVRTECVGTAGTKDGEVHAH